MCLVDVCRPVCGCLYVFFTPLTGPGSAGENVHKDLCFSTLFSHRFLDGFLMVLASILDDFFDDFPMFFASHFRHLFYVFLKFSESIFEPCEP